MIAADGVKVGDGNVVAVAEKGKELKKITVSHDVL